MQILQAAKGPTAHLYDVVEMLERGVNGVLQLQQNQISSQGEEWLLALFWAGRALLRFAEMESRCDIQRPNGTDNMPGSMQLAAEGAACICSLATCLPSCASILNPAQLHSSICPAEGNEVTAAKDLRRLLAWLAETTTPLATASAVLAEGLAGLTVLVATYPRNMWGRAEVGGLHEWAPVAAALHRRLPRRMKSRFLPRVDHITAALQRLPGFGVDTGDDAGSVTAAERAMAATAVTQARNTACTPYWRMSHWLAISNSCCS